MKNLSIMLTDAMYTKVIDHKLDSSVPVQIVESIRHGKEIRWIPVSERLPEINGNYLVQVSQGGLEYIAIDHRNSDNTWTDTDGRYRKIVAWQPLPKPYSEESK